MQDHPTRPSSGGPPPAGADGRRGARIKSEQHRALGNVVRYALARRSLSQEELGRLRTADRGGDIVSAVRYRTEPLATAAALRGSTTRRRPQPPHASARPTAEPDTETADLLKPADVAGG